MSVVEPTIDELLAVTDENRFLLCEMAARRARDINDMMGNQHKRAEQLADIEDISSFLCDDEGRSPNPLSIAFSEIAPKRDEESGAYTAGSLSYDRRNLNDALGLSSTVEEVVEDVVDTTIEDLVSEMGDLISADETEEA